jgi:hypothetical protein
MKYDLVKVYHWLSTSTFRNKWFEENVKLQIICLLSWFIYSDYRKSNSFFSVMRKNKFILNVFFLFLFWTFIFFSFGKIMSETKKTYEYIFLERVKEKIVIQKEYDRPSRYFIQNIIIEECNLKHNNNLKKLPDDIFFTMVEEVTKKKIPYKIFFKIVDHESGFLWVSNTQGSGALGYCQIMPCTYRNYKRKLGLGKHTPKNNIIVGTTLLKERYDFYKKRGNNTEKSWILSLTDYAGGSDTMAKNITSHTFSKN